MLRGEDPKELTLEEDGILAPTGVIGERSIYFLALKRDSDGRYFRLVTSQGRYLIRNNDLTPSNGDQGGQDHGCGNRRSVAPVQSAHPHGVTPPTSSPSMDV